jgi:hypothetical protein
LGGGAAPAPPQARGHSRGFSRTPTEGIQCTKVPQEFDGRVKLKDIHRTAVARWNPARVQRKNVGSQRLYRSKRNGRSLRHPAAAVGSPTIVRRSVLKSKTQKTPEVS